MINKENEFTSSPMDAGGRQSQTWPIIQILAWRAISSDEQGAIAGRCPADGSNGYQPIDS